MVRNRGRKIFPTDYRWRLRVERYDSAVEAKGSRWHMTLSSPHDVVFCKPLGRA